MLVARADDGSRVMLEFDDVHVGYGRSVVLHGVVRRRARRPASAAVLGHNGAGKSTLLRAAIGLLRPRGGTVTFAGDDVTRLAPHERVARGHGATCRRASSASRT